MIVWGGETPFGLTNTGGIYDFATDSWTPTNTIGAPSARSGHTAVWTGQGMIIWGGETATGYASIAKVYWPNLDIWSTLGGYGTPPTSRTSHTAVWTGSWSRGMIVWGGETDTGLTQAGASFITPDGFFGGRPRQ